MSVEKLTYSVKEIKAATGLSDEVITAAIRRGELAHIRAGLKGLGKGRRILVPAESLRSWIAAPLKGDQ